MLSRKFATAILLAAAVAGIAVVVGLNMATRSIRNLALRLMGPGSSVAEMHMHPTWVELRGVRIPPSDNWPAQASMTADSIEIHPALSTLFSDEIRIRHAEGHGVYFSVLRTGDRQIRFLPTILPRPPRDPSRPPPRHVYIERATVDGGTLDFYDASIRQPAQHLTVVDVQGEASDMLFPVLTTKAPFAAHGRPVDSKDGKVAIEGWTVFKQREGEFKVTLENLDIHHLEPYFLRNRESGSASGRLDLDMDAKIHDHYLDAPGHMRLTDFELDTGEGPVATFMGLPRKAVIAAMSDKKGSIDLSFEMKGNLGDAKFSLNETFAVRVAAGIGNALGLTIGGVVKGISSVGESGIDAVGGAFGSLFGAGDKKKEPDPPKPEPTK